MAKRKTPVENGRSATPTPASPHFVELEIAISNGDLERAAEELKRLREYGFEVMYRPPRQETKSA